MPEQDVRDDEPILSVVVGMAAQFRLLGELEVRVGDRVVEVGHTRQRCVLVALLVDANCLVPVDQLIDRVWADCPPLRARSVLYNYLSRLRQVLAAADDVHIAHQPGGYVLAVDPLAVDLHRFQHLTDRAGSADSDADALALLERALGLWRGEVLTTVDTPWLNAVRNNLDGKRFAVELDRNDLALRQGHHARLLADLVAAVTAHPLD
jgi:DNA-binding SARP family transcriptional activator